jgi:hypothetical protein
VLLYRADGMPLTARHVWVLWDWVFDVMNQYGGDDETLEETSARCLTRRALGGFVRQSTARAAAQRAQREGEEEEEEERMAPPPPGVAF